ncbi:MAG: hypothetical protein FWH20_07375 [Oscillospiraceae bacterium]|nr:hypothetical protein [Oscillospiraceae bacterium]
MIALIIIGAVLLLIAVIMSLPLVFVIDYEKEAEIKLRLLFFDLLKDRRRRPRKARKVRKARGGDLQSPVKSTVAEPAQATANTANTAEPAQSGVPPAEPAATPPEKPLRDSVKTGSPKKGIRKNIPEIDMKLIRMLLDSFAHPFKRLLKRVKITELYIDSVVGGDDAAKAAINFGLQNAAIYSAVAWLKSISSVRTERISIRADFMREDGEFFLHCKVRIKIGTVVVCGLLFLLKVMRYKAREAEPPPVSSGKANVGKRIHIVLD